MDVNWEKTMALAEGSSLQHAVNLLPQRLDLGAALEAAAAHAPQDASLLAHGSCHSSRHLHFNPALFIPPASMQICAAHAASDRAAPMLL